MKVKSMKRIIAFMLIGSVLALFPTVSADTSNEIYDEIYNESGMSEITANLDKETTDILTELGVDPENFNSFLEMDTKNLWSVLMDMLGRNITAPLTAFSTALAVILICSLLGDMWSNGIVINQTYNYVSLLSISSIVLMPLTTTVENSIAGIKTISGFMLTFVPVYGGLLLYSGNATTSVLYQSLMLGMSEAVSQISGFIIAPMISVFICVGMASAISGIDGAYKFSLMIKNVANWILGLVMTLFTGFLSVQSFVGKSADNLAIKTTRFFVGSTVPVVGGYLSETLTTLTAGVGLLRASATAWCILALGVMVLPLVIELFLWRTVLNLLSAISEMLSVSEISKLFNVSSVAIGFLIAILLCVSAMFILSLVVIKAGI